MKPHRVTEYNGCNLGSGPHFDRIKALQETHFDCRYLHTYADKASYWTQKQLDKDIRCNFIYPKDHFELKKIATFYEQAWGEWINAKGFMNFIEKQGYKVAVMSEKRKGEWVSIGFLPYTLTP